MLMRLHFFPVKAKNVYFLTVNPKLLWHTLARVVFVSKLQDKYSETFILTVFNRLGIA